MLPKPSFVRLAASAGPACIGTIATDRSCWRPTASLHICHAHRQAVRNPAATPLHCAESRARRDGTTPRWHLCGRPDEDLRAERPCPRASHSDLSQPAESLEAVIIVDHGSRRAESNHMLHEFADLYRRVSGRTLVEVAHMELASPSVADAVDAAVAAGAHIVTIAPYFLSRGRHIQDDIPALVQAAAAKHPGVQCRLAEPLGIDPLMAHLIEKRVMAAAHIQGSKGLARAQPVAVG